MPARDKSHQQNNPLAASLREVDGVGFDRPAKVDPNAQSAASRFAELRAKNAPALDPEQMRELQARIDELEAELSQARHELSNRPDIAIETALIPVESGVRALGRFILTSRSLISPDQVTGDELDLILTFLKEVKGALQFWIGDIVLACVSLGKNDDTGEPDEGKSKAVFNQLSAYLEIDHDTLTGWVRVCKRIDPTRRRVDLEFSHHAEVANLKPELRGRADEILDYCEKNRLSVQGLRAHIRSLLPAKTKPRPVAALFSKDRVPRLAALKTTYLRARRGDKTATSEMKDTLKSYREWLDEIEKSLGIK